MRVRAASTEILDYNVVYEKKSKDTIKTHPGEKTLHLRERYAVYNLGITF